MDIELDLNRICLKRKQLLQLRRGIGRTIVCDSGSVWLTQDGDTRDIMLHAGEAFTLDRDGPALLQACAPSVIAVRQAVERTRLARWTAFLRGAIVGAGFGRDAVRA